MKQSGAERTAVRVRNSFPAEDCERSPANPTGPRFIIENIYPCVDGGRYPVKRIAGEVVEVWADIFREGHDVLVAVLLWRSESAAQWQREPMQLHGNDRWHGRFAPPEPGAYLFAIEAWTDQFATWRKEFMLRKEAGQDLALPAREGHELLAELTPRERKARLVVEDYAKKFAAEGNPGILLDDVLAAAMEKTQTRPDLTLSAVVPVLAERKRARCGNWYEMVPRSQGTVEGKHGTFDDCITRVPEIAALGFDVLYLTPIHPVGRTNRKGKNNSLNAGPDDPGSFYSIGNEHGGHDAIEPRLGSLEDFRHLAKACADHKMEIALDFAVQCSLDHPWLKDHPEWFRFRPDGSIRFAE
ncbi:MAG: maltotransferase domain-containing protein, partial [Pseudolabrys sp.]